MCGLSVAWRRMALWSLGVLALVAWGLVAGLAPSFGVPPNPGELLGGARPDPGPFGSIVPSVITIINVIWWFALIICSAKLLIAFVGFRIARHRGVGFGEEERNTAVINAAVALALVIAFKIIVEVIYRLIPTG